MCDDDFGFREGFGDALAIFGSALEVYETGDVVFCCEFEDGVDDVFFEIDFASMDLDTGEPEGRDCVFDLVIGRFGDVGEGVGVGDEAVWKCLVGFVCHLVGLGSGCSHGKDNGFVDVCFVHGLHDAFGCVFGAFFVAVFEVAVGVDDHFGIPWDLGLK